MKTMQESFLIPYQVYLKKESKCFPFLIFLNRIIKKVAYHFLRSATKIPLNTINRPLKIRIF